VIFETGSEWENFVPEDYKKRDGYRRSCEIARQSGFYRQNYCGCEFSLRDRGGKDENDLS
jgi:predicted adenine nucleotide alpha hydrolase (AANH) superfamily ATPase